MEASHAGLRQRFGPDEQHAGAFVDSSRLAFFLVGHGKDAQGQEFIDLGRVEQIARAFGCHLGVIIENDRRRQDGAGRSFLPRKNRPRSLIFACRRGILQRLRRIHQRDESAVTDSQDHVCRCKGAHLGFGAPAAVTRRRHGRQVFNPQCQPEDARRHLARGNRDFARDVRAGPDQHAGDAPVLAT